MGLFGGGNSSNRTTTNNYDNRRIEENDNEGDLSGNKGNISIYSTGSEAFDFAARAFDTFEAINEQNQDSLTGAFASISNAQAEAISGGQSGIVNSISNTVKWSAVALAVAFAVRGLK